MTATDITRPDDSGKTISCASCAAKVQLEYVYAIAATDGAIKIGRASDLEKRLAALQKSQHRQLRVIYAEACLDGEASRVERMAHKILAKQRISGEWFQVSIIDAGQAISRAADEVRTQANLKEMESRGSDGPSP